ncbi:MAG: hypothetical protein HYT72_00130 [Candidatus Aenigmarchaeota archaeon]|nr:hypothetical protein [Candidatus Aenigmarchaeota archaeon]
MRKSTQQKIMVAFIIFTFSFSSLAFFFTSSVPVEEFRPLENFVIDGELDAKTESVYVQNGFTSLKFFYNDTNLIDYVNQLPELTMTNTNQVQLIVQKIPGKETFLVINNRNNQEELRNITRSSIFLSLCRLLTITPVECGLLNRTG